MVAPKITDMAAPSVLVVEDDPSIQSTLCATLTLVGYGTLRAASVDAALEILASEHVDAVTLDVRLPDLKGLERSGLTILGLIRARAEYANVPVVIFTGVPLSPEDEALAQKQNAEILYKPQPYSVLIAHLNRLLDRQPAA
jgi:DNA-binding response OmpR family regulator